MDGKIEVGFNRLPTLEVLGAEYPYDVTSKTVISKINEISKQRADTLDGFIALYKDFITTVFCGDPKVVREIEKVIGDRMQLWADIAVQVATYVTGAKYQDIRQRINNLKALADKRVK